LKQLLLLLLLLPLLLPPLLLLLLPPLLLLLLLLPPLPLLLLARLSEDIGLHLALEEETKKWFPASNSSREVSCCDMTIMPALLIKWVLMK
jgi:hypothetical protein